MKLLLLAGTPEAVHIGQALGRDSRVVAIASLARAGRSPSPMNLPMRIGGWGGDAAFAEWLLRERITAVLDATHPFASKLSHRTAEVCALQGISYAQFLRPAWVPGAHDKWVFLNSEAEAASHIPDHSNVLLTTGWRGIETYGDMGERTVYGRVAEQRDLPFPFRHGRYVHYPAALSPAAEMEALHDLKINWIVARNSGGGGNMSVIEAARQLGLPVGMIRRPPQPEALRIRTVTEALAWVRRRL